MYQINLITHLIIIDLYSKTILDVSNGALNGFQYNHYQTVSDP